MNVKKEGTQVSNYVVQHLPRNPSIFSGEDGEDLQKWLKGYARVARYNHWDETLCLTKVYFYLSGTALKWFENNEESIQTWKEFTSQLENVFGKKENSKLQAEKKLETRAQLKGESTEFYIQDVLCLCKEVDPQMSEEDKISHLMKGIAEELYQALLPRDVQSTEQFITECRRVEALRCRRVTPTRYERLPNVASLCDQDDGEDLSPLIRLIVREEVQRALGSPREEPKNATIEEIVKEEIGRTLAPISKSRRSPPQKEKPRQFLNTRYEAETIRPHPEPRYPKQGGRRDTNDWRTTEGRPICFYCGRPGHVVRYCRDRKRHNEERRNDYFQRKQDAMVSYNSRAESQDPNDESSRKTFTRYRSPTSYRGMPSHRRSNLSQRSNSSRVQHAYRLRETRGQNIRRLRAQSARQAAVRSLETPDPIHSRLQAHSEIYYSTRRNTRTNIFFSSVWSSMENAGFNYSVAVEYFKHPLISLGMMDTTCRFCGALRWKDESSGMCCSNGKVRLPLIDLPPEPLRSLLSGENSDSVHFLRNIRKYNSCFQMTSFGTENQTHSVTFPTTFSIQGQVYHRIGSLMPSENQPSRFLQIYFMVNDDDDDDIQTDRRCQQIQGVRRNILQGLQRMLHQHNLLVQQFKTALENLPSDAYRVVVNADRTPPGQHPRRYNAPTANEVAVVLAESERLRYITLHQRNLRAESYIHLRDALSTDANINPNSLGQRIILPSSFVNSPRYLAEYTQDAFCHVRKFGRPDLFITFTSNPSWEELSAALLPGQKQLDRHDITARVFRQKLVKFIGALTKGQLYGATVAWMYSVEWQKRGLPHAHILVWLANKLRPTQIDSVICAEFPDPIQDPLLYNIVVKNMIHGPCGEYNPVSPCMKNSSCSKKYPKQFLLETQTNENGYPLYRRRAPEAGGFTAKPSEEQQNHIRHLNSPKEVWDELQRLYAPRDSKHRILQLRRKLYSQKFCQHANMDAYLGSINLIVSELTGVGDKIEDGDLSMLILCGMPEDWDNVISTMCNLPESEFTSANIRHKLLAEAERRYATTNEGMGALSVRNSNKKQFPHEHQGDWPKWIRFERFRQASGLIKIPENEQVNMLVYCMGDNADDILLSCKIASDQLENYGKVIECFESHFIPRRNIIYERARFNQRCQQEGEKVNEFITALHSLAEHCNFGMLHDELIRDRIVVGVRDRALSERMQLDTDLTLVKATLMAKQLESVKEQQSSLYQQDSVYQIKKMPNHIKEAKRHEPKIRQFKSNQLGGSSHGCTRCGNSNNHDWKNCPAMNSYCSKCKKKGHYSNVNNRQINFKIDTGADVNVLPLQYYYQSFQRIKLEKSDKVLQGPNGIPLETAGMIHVKLQNKGQHLNSKIYIVDKLKQPLLSGETSEKLNIVRMIQQLSSNFLNPKREFPKIFNGLGHAKINYKISLQPDAKPYALCTPRRVPIPLMKQVKEQLEEMTRLGVIESVEEPTEWCAGMVAVSKPGGKIRICVDLTKLNQYIRRENYPLPATEHILGQLGNACYFSKLDANSGFWQFGLAKESQKLTTFITPFGRFFFKRIPFGITSAPEIFQRKMTQLLGNIEGVVCFMDDIVVYGSSLEEHNERVRQVLKKIQEEGMTLNPEKCQFGVKTVKFLGHTVSSEGLFIDEEKLDAITKMGRRLRTSVPAIESSLMPRYLDSEALQEREKRRVINQKRLYDKRHDVHSLPLLQQGDSVWVRDQRVKGKVLHKSEEPRSYWVQTPQGKVRRNRLHLTPLPKMGNTMDASEDDQDDQEQETEEDCPTPTASSTRDGRMQRDNQDQDPEKSLPSMPAVHTRYGRAVKIPRRSTKETQTLALVHCDLMGPFNIESWGGSRFVLTIIDDASRYTRVYFLKRKGDTLEKFKEWMKEAENKTGFSLKRIRTDNGLEFCSSPWDILSKAHGIVHERTMVYTPEQNGVAERMNRTLLNLVRSTVNSCNLPTASWAELTNTAAYLRNRVTNRHNEEKTPFELWFGKRPALQHLRAIGCETFVHVPKQRRNSKLQPRATKGILVGYSLQGRGWRIWIPEKRQVVESRNCVFNKEILYKQPKRERDTLPSVHFSSKEASFQEESNADQPVDRETEELIGTT
ncbi:hypothetical protein LAZ67_18001431, partial [Cordylochernes scorpioides]